MATVKADHPALSTFASSAGCACKIPQFDLAALLKNVPSASDPNLLVGNAESDDAAVYRLPGGQTIVQTIDFFTPVVDDPRLFGRIAATNALSDVYAMRGRPVLALAVVAFPMKVLPGAVLEEILRGGAEKVAEAGAVIAGGHSIDHDIPLYGLSVTGVVDEAKVTRNMGAKPGDALVLTKPLGIGVTVRAGRIDSAAGSEGAIGAQAVGRRARGGRERHVHVEPRPGRGDGRFRHPCRDRRDGIRPARPPARDDGRLEDDGGGLDRPRPAALAGAAAGGRRRGAGRLAQQRAPPAARAPRWPRA